MEAGERVNALGTKKLFPLIVSMSIPAICGNITTALYNVVDRLFVGQFVGRNALGAIGLMFPLNNVTSAITVLLTIGGGALISLSLGRKEKDKADEAFTNIVSMGAILAFIVTLFFFIFASQLISLCGARESSALHNPAVDYLRIIAIGQFFQIMNLGLAGAIRAEGNVRYSMVVSMIGALLNIGLDALFIIVFNAGLQGAAAATALSQVVGATVSALYFTRKKSVLRWAGLKSVRFKKMLEIAGLGAAPAVFQGFGLVNNLITNNSLMIYGNNEMGAGGGDLAISALSVVNTVESIALMVVLGMNNAISTIISYNYGAKQYQKDKKCSIDWSGNCICDMHGGMASDDDCTENIICNIFKRRCPACRIWSNGNEKIKDVYAILGISDIGFDVLFGNRKTKGCNIYFNQQERIIFNSGIVDSSKIFGTEWSFIQFKCFRFLFTYTCINYIHKWNFTIE